MASDYKKLTVHSCIFEANIKQANLTLKFPCELMVQWKLASGKKFVVSKNKVKINDSVAIFNQTLSIESELLFNEEDQQFIKKQSLLQLNLITANKPDPKLVGRISIDLAEIIHHNKFKNPQKHQLKYSSVNAALIFSIKFLAKRPLEKDPKDVDKQSFGEYFSFHSGKINQLPQKQHTFRAAIQQQQRQSRKNIRSSIVNKKTQTVESQYVYPEDYENYKSDKNQNRHDLIKIEYTPAKNQRSSKQKSNNISSKSPIDKIYIEHQNKHQLNIQKDVQKMKVSIDEMIDRQQTNQNVRYKTQQQLSKLRTISKQFQIQNNKLRIQLSHTQKLLNDEIRKLKVERGKNIQLIKKLDQFQIEHSIAINNFREEQAKRKVLENEVSKLLKDSHDNRFNRIFQQYEQYKQTLQKQLTQQTIKAKKLQQQISKICSSQNQSKKISTALKQFDKIKEKLQNQILQEKIKYRQLKSQMSKFQHQTSLRIQQLNKEIKHKNQQLQQLQKQVQLNKLKDQNSKDSELIEESYKKFKQKINDEVIAKNKLQDKLNELQNSYQQKIRSLETQLKATKSHLNEELKNQIDKNMDLTTQYEIVVNKLQNIQSNSINMRENFTKSQDQYKIMIKKLQLAIEKSIDNCSKQKKPNNQQTDSLRKQISDLLMKIATYQQTTIQLQNKIYVLMHKVQQQQDNYRSLETQNYQLITTIKSHQQTIQTLKSKGTQQQNIEITKKQQANEQYNLQTEKQLINKQIKLENITIELNQTRYTLQQKQYVISKLNDTIRELEDNQINLNNKVNSIYDDMDRRDEEWGRKVGTLMEKLQNRQQQTTQIKKKLLPGSQNNQQSNVQISEQLIIKSEEVQTLMKKVFDLNALIEQQSFVLNQKNQQNHTLIERIKQLSQINSIPQQNNSNEELFKQIQKLQQQRDTYKMLIQSLQHQKNSLLTQKQQLIKEKLQLQDYYQSRQQTSPQLQQNKPQLQSTTINNQDNLYKTINELQIKLYEQSQELSNALLDKNKLIQKNDLLLIEISQLNKKIKQSKQSYQETELNKHKQIQQQLHQQISVSVQIQRQNKIGKQQQKQQQVQLQQQQLMLRSQQQQQIVIKQAQINYEEQLKSYVAQLQNLNLELASMKVQNQSLKEMERILLEQNENLMLERNNQEDQKNLIKIQLDNNMLEYNRFKQENQLHLKSIEQLNDLIKNNVENIQKLQQISKNSIKQKQLLQKQISQLQDKSNQSLIQIQTLIKEIQIMRNQLQDKQNQNINIQQALTNNIAQFNNKIKQLQQRNVKLSASIENYQQTIKQQTQLIESFNQRIMLTEQQKKIAEECFQIKKLELSNILKEKEILSTSFQSNKTTLLNQIYTLRAHINQLQSDYQKLKIQSNRIRDNLLSKSQQNQKFFKIIEEKVQNEQVNQSRITKFIEKQAKMRLNLSVLEQQSRKIFEIVQNKQQNQQVTYQQLQERNSVIAELEALLQQKINLIVDLQFNQTQLREKLNTYNQTINDMQSQREGLYSQLENFKLSADYQSYKLQQLEKQHVAQKQTIEELNHQLFNIKNSLNQQQSHKISLSPNKSPNPKTQQLLKQKDNKIAQLQKQNKQIEQSLLKLENEYHNIKCQKQLAQSQQLQKFNKLNDQIHELNIKVYSSKAQVAKIQNQLIVAELQKSNIQEKLMALTTNKVTKSNIQNQLIKEKQDEIKNLKLQLQIAQSQTTKIKKLQQKNSSLEEQIVRLEEDLFAYTSEQNQKQILIEQLKEENGHLLSKIQYMEFEINQYQIKLQQLTYNVQPHLNTQLNTYIASYPLNKQQYLGLESNNTYHTKFSQDQRNQKTMLQAKLTELVTQIQQLSGHLASVQTKLIANTSDKPHNQSQYIKRLEYQIEEHENRQMEQTQKLLDLQFKLDEQRKQKNRLADLISRKGENRNDASYIAVAHQDNYSEIYNLLYNLLQKRLRHQQIQSIVQRLVQNKKKNQLHLERLTEQRGTIQQKARTLSMQYQKLKASILKSKINNSQKSQILSVAKVSQIVVNEIVKLSQTLANVRFINININDI